MCFITAARTLSSIGQLMRKVLNVAEKNDAAKSLAAVLSRGTSHRREGYSKFNKIYEFPYNLSGVNVQMAMTSVSGHLLDLKFPDQYKNWRSCSPLVLFDAPVYTYCPDGNLNLKKTLQREAKDSEQLIIWTDCDREGEHIGFEVIDTCLQANPRLKVSRAKFSEITAASINRAILDLQQPNEMISNAVAARQELDLRIGAAFTRFQTLRFTRLFQSALKDSLISYGSCQFPTLGFVVDRYLERENFIVEPFWTIDLTHSQDGLKVAFNWARGRVFDHHICTALYSQMMTPPGSMAEVVELKENHRTKRRPFALDTVEFEKLASRKLHVNAKEAMRVAEKLYTSGLISYPRTETNTFAESIDLRGIVEKQVGRQGWGEFAQKLLDGGLTPRNGSKNDGAHPPIHPVKYPENQLTGTEKAVYELVTRHFLACLHKDAEGMETRVTLDLNEEKFHATGLRITARNYLEVYIYDTWSDKELPPGFKLGVKFVPDELIMRESKTVPPALLTEAELIALMDKHGIGTDATHAEHIETIKNRGYVGMTDDRRFAPGKLGMGLVEGYNTMGYELAKPRLRAELEVQLQRICEGATTKEIVLKDQIVIYRRLFEHAMDKVGLLDTSLAKYFQRDQGFSEEDASGPDGQTMISDVMKCPFCGKPSTLRFVDKIGKWVLSCTMNSECNFVVWLPKSIALLKPCGSTCPNCTDLHAKKVLLKLERHLIAFGLSHEETEVCLLCNNDFRDATGLDIRTAPPARPRTVPPVNTGRGGSRGGGRGSRGTARGGHSAIMQSRQTSGSRTSGTRAISARGTPSRRTRGAGRARGSRASKKNTPGRTPFTDKGDRVCMCGEAPVELVTRSEGINKGRHFLKCAKNQCNFFEWASPIVSDVSSGFGMSAGDGSAIAPNAGFRSATNASNNNNNADESDDDIPRCMCGNKAKCFTVRKEGPNTGRQFYGCALPQSSKCDFFKWHT